jgi:hypothetical protein
MRESPPPKESTQNTPPAARLSEAVELELGALEAALSRLLDQPGEPKTQAKPAPTPVPGAES